MQMKDFMISCLAICIVVGGRLFISARNVCIILRGHRLNFHLAQPPSCVFVCQTASACVRGQASSCPRCPFLEFMVTIVASASVFYEAAGGVSCQAFWLCV